MKKKIKINNNHSETTIIIKNNFIKKYIRSSLRSQNKIFCIVDSKLKNVFKNLKDNKKIKFIFIKCGENIKNIKTYNNLCEKLLKSKIDRESKLIVIGGGTLGDLCGFIAKTILRGINFTLIPTTLLSQVDSSLGGKNGINASNGKNLIGTFNHPTEVIIDISVLKTLPKREIKSGYSEIVKHAIINDYKFFIWLDKNYKKIFELNSKITEEAIFRSLMIKLSYVKKDPFEKLINSNSRSMLNFGHTFGHALEALYNYKKSLNHGEAISIGMVMESRIANKMGYLSKEHLNIIIEHFSKAGLKIEDQNIRSNKIFKYLINDKKNFNDNINIVLLNGIGNSFFARKISANKIKKTLKYI